MEELETEVKFELTQQEWSALCFGQHIRDHEKILASSAILENVYYDQDGLLAAAGITLRARRKVSRGYWKLELKVPVSNEEGVRAMREITDDFPMIASPAAEVFVLPPHFQASLPADLQHITQVQRLGELRVGRYVQQHEEGFTFDIDRLTLPNGTLFHEVEIELADPDLRAQAIAKLRSIVPDCRPSTLSKFTRFLAARQEVIRRENGLKRHIKILHKFTPRLKGAYERLLLLLGVEADTITLETERDALLTIVPVINGLNTPLPCHTQRKTIAKDGYGDCLRTCVAIVLGLEPEDVPIFGFTEDGQPTGNQGLELRAWLRERGLAIQYMHTSPQLLQALAPTGYHLLSGISPRRRADGGLIHHTVVGYRGELYFDPHPEGQGLERVDEYAVFYELEPS